MSTSFWELLLLMTRLQSTENTVTFSSLRTTSFSHLSSPVTTRKQNRSTKNLSPGFSYHSPRLEESSPVRCASWPQQDTRLISDVIYSQLKGLPESGCWDDSWSALREIYSGRFNGIVILVLSSTFVKVFEELKTTFLSRKTRQSCEEQSTHWVMHQNYK